MVRSKILYASSSAIFLLVCAFTLASILLPHWISWKSQSPSGQRVLYTYGLHQRCSSLTGKCTSFPQPADCQHDRFFCSMWRSVGFILSLAIVMEGMTLLTYLVLLIGSRQKREGGWRILVFLTSIVALLLGAAMSIVAYLYNNDDRFFPGWKLDASWFLCTTGFILTTLIIAGITAAVLLLAPEGGYELVPSQEPTD